MMKERERTKLGEYQELLKKEGVKLDFQMIIFLQMKRRIIEDLEDELNRREAILAEKKCTLCGTELANKFSWYITWNQDTNHMWKMIVKFLCKECTKIKHHYFE